MTIKESQYPEEFLIGQIQAEVRMCLSDCKSADEAIADIAAAMIDYDEDQARRREEADAVEVVTR